MAKWVWLTVFATATMALANMKSTAVFNVESSSEGRCEVCPLSRVKAGVEVRVRRICASPEVQSRLREIGLCEDQIIRLLTSQTNLICQVCNTRLAISEQLASLIFVEPVVRPAAMQ